MKEIVKVIPAIYLFLHHVGDWWYGVSITGTVNPPVVLIGQPVIISCDVQGCGSPILQVHLTKWEDSKNQTLYVHSTLQKHEFKRSKATEEDKEGTQMETGSVVVNEYKNGLFQVTLPQAELSNSGQYVCGVQCNDTHKEAVLDVVVKGVINVAVSKAATFPCLLSGSSDPSYLKFQLKKIRSGKSHTLVTYLYQATCPAFCLQDSFRERHTCSNRPSPRIWLRKEYEHRIEIPRGDLFGRWNTSLKLNKVQVEDGGDYKCLVESKLLRKVVIFSLSVKENSSQNTENFSWCHHVFTVVCLIIVLIAVACCFDWKKEEIRQLNIENENIRQLNIMNEEIKILRAEVEKYKRLHTEICDPEGFLAWTQALDYSDTITLDADSAHPCITIENRSFTLGIKILPVPPNPQRFDGIVAVLGQEGFSSGNHYWEVDVGSSSDWDLGVARKSIKRKGILTLSPKEGFWVLGLTGRDYFAKTDPWTRITAQRKPDRIGVYLCFQENNVTFFNVTDKTILFAFKECEFSEEIYPFFKNGDKGKTMHVSAK